MHVESSAIWWLLCVFFFFFFFFGGGGGGGGGKLSGISQRLIEANEMLPHTIDGRNLFEIKWQISASVSKPGSF